MQHESPPVRLIDANDVDHIIANEVSRRLAAESAGRVADISSSIALWMIASTALAAAAIFSGAITLWEYPVVRGHFLWGATWLTVAAMAQIAQTGLFFVLCRPDWKGAALWGIRLCWADEPWCTQKISLARNLSAP
jgi:hypothetical protein